MADILKLNANLQSPTLTQKRILIFWLPLASSWLLMMCEIPFISAAIARLPNAQTMIAAFGITASISITVESPVIMLLATTTALAANQQAYLTIRRFTLHLMVLGTIAQVLVAFTPLYGVVVSGWMGIPVAIATAAQPGLQIMTFWTAAIGWRRFKQGVMIRFGQTRLIGIGTIIRLAFSAGSATVLALSHQFNGVAVGSLALMAGVTAEMIYTQLASNTTIRQISREVTTNQSSNLQRESSGLSYSALLKYHTPLAAVSLLTLLGQPLIGAALARATHPEGSLAAWPVVFSLIGIFRSLPLALPEAVIALQRGPDTQAALRRFCISVGFVTSGSLLLLAVTPLGNFYLNNLIGLDPDLTQLALPGVLLGIAIPFIMAIQSFWRGLLMSRKATSAVYIAMMINLLTLALVLVLGVVVKAPGVQLAMVALTLALITEGAYLAWQVNQKATA